MSDEPPFEKRESQRYYSGIVVQLMFSGNQTRLYGFLDDISEGGIAVITPFSMNPRDHLSIRLNMEQSRQKVDLFCYVVYCRRQPYDLYGQISYRSGLKMMDPDEATLAVIREYIEYIREQESPLFRKNILLVSESHTSQYLLTQILISSGFKVSNAMNLNEVLESISLTSYDLCIVDLSMQGSKVLETVEKIKSIHPETKFLFSSSMECPKNLELAKKYGADLYIVSPTNSDLFINLVTNTLKEEQM